MENIEDIDRKIKEIRLRMKNPLSPEELQDKSGAPSKDIFNEYIIQLERERDSIIPPKKLLFLFFYNKKINKINKEISSIRSLSDDYMKWNDEKRVERKTQLMKNLVKKTHTLDIKGYLRERTDSRNPDKTFMINMELRNGMHTHFMVVLTAKYYDFLNGRYIIDDKLKYYDVASKIYCLDYHQDCCMPLMRRFDMNAVEKAAVLSGMIETETKLNPKSLNIFMESDIIQKIMKGAELDSWIRFVKMMLIIILVIVIIILLLQLKGILAPTVAKAAVASA